MPEILSCIEHSTLKLVTERAPFERALSLQHAALLEKLALTLPAGAISWGNQSVRFSQYCGVIQLGELTIEVLPKVHGKELQPESCRAALIHMLYAARVLNSHRGGSAGINTQNHTLLDIFVQHFCQDVHGLLLQGKLKSYVTQEDNLPVLRGRLAIPQNIKHNMVHRERLYCHFDEFSDDILINQIIRFTLKLLIPLVRSRQTKTTLHELLMHFDGIHDTAITIQTFKKLNNDRFSLRYQPVIEQCRLFLSGMKPNVLAGGMALFSLLFDMNRLFEAWVAELLKPWAHQKGWYLRTQGPRKYLAQRQDNGHDVFQMRPDIAFVDEKDNVVMIADTKWKLLNSDDRKFGINQGDAYQLYAYAGRYAIPHVQMIYPAQVGLGKSFKFQMAGVHQSMLTVKTVAIEKLKSLEWSIE